MKGIQYSIRGVSKHLDDVLRKKAVREGCSLNSAVLGAIQHGLGITGETRRYDDLGDLAGTWVDDPEFDKALAEMDKVDPDQWR